MVNKQRKQVGHRLLGSLRYTPSHACSLKKAVRSHRRSRRAFLSAAILLTVNYAGPRDSLVRQPTVCLMGQCEPIISITVQGMGPCKWLHMVAFRLLKANSSSSARAVRFASWANTSISLQSLHPQAQYPLSGLSHLFGPRPTNQT